MTIRHQRKSNAQGIQEDILRFDFSNMMSDNIKVKGIKLSEITNRETQYSSAVENLQKRRQAGQLAWMDLPYNQAEIVADIIETTEKIRNNYKYFIVIGIGGSALGPQAVQQALNPVYYNDLPEDKRRSPKMYFLDNADPEKITSLLEIIDLQQTMVSVITKSGGTVETMSQFMLVWDILWQQLGEKAVEHIIAITDSKKGLLHKIARDYQLKSFYIAEGVGGRFSELSPVGLLSAAVGGIDIEQLLAGAARIDKVLQNENVWENPALMAAALQLSAIDKGCNISVIMPYAESLKYFADWFAQLWAESLGKKYDLQGKEVFAGQTPVKALGSVDQHSQVQLYTEGPFDKVITFITVNNYRSNIIVPRVFADIAELSFLSGHSFNEIMQAEQLGTEYALTQAERLNCKIILPEINAYTIGQLIYFLEVTTALAGELINIDAYNQPGVEEGKAAAYALLDRMGYDDKKKEIEHYLDSKEKYII